MKKLPSEADDESSEQSPTPSDDDPKEGNTHESRGTDPPTESKGAVDPGEFRAQFFDQPESDRSQKPNDMQQSVTQTSQTAVSSQPMSSTPPSTEISPMSEFNGLQAANSCRQSNEQALDTSSEPNTSLPEVDHKYSESWGIVTKPGPFPLSGTRNPDFYGNNKAAFTRAGGGSVHSEGANEGPILTSENVPPDSNHEDEPTVASTTDAMGVANAAPGARPSPKDKIELSMPRGADLPQAPPSQINTPSSNRDSDAATRNLESFINGDSGQGNSARVDASYGTESGNLDSLTEESSEMRAPDQSAVDASIIPFHHEDDKTAAPGVLAIVTPTTQVHFLSHT